MREGEPRLSTLNSPTINFCYGETVTFTASVQSPLGVPLSQKRIRYSRVSVVLARGNLLSDLRSRLAHLSALTNPVRMAYRTKPAIS